MSDASELYLETQQCYEQLLIMSQSAQQFTSEAASQLMQICSSKIDTLLQMEYEFVTNHGVQGEINSSLLLLKQDISQIRELQQVLIRRKFSAKAKAVVTTLEENCFNQNQVSLNKPNEENTEGLKSEIKNTEIKPSVKGLHEIAGLESVKKTLATIMILPIHQPQLFEGRRICNSLLLYGPPGTGKTLLAHAMAAEVSGRLFSVTSGNILSQYVGQTERMLRALFQTIKEATTVPKILFVDEIDGLCQHRKNNETEYTRRLKTQLMCELSSFEDCPNVYLICATNCPWDIDPALLRRFQRRIYIPIPNRSERFELLRLLTKEAHLDIAPHLWGPLLNKTEGYSGSDMANLVRNATNIPIEELYGTTLWILDANSKYKPAMQLQNYENVIRCELHELPPNSIQVRSVTISDLVMSADVVTRTVSEEDIQKYEDYNRKH